MADCEVCGADTERIAELDKQLAEALVNETKWYDRYQDRFEKESRGREREVALVKALEWIEGRVESYTKNTRSDNYELATDIKKKIAALEVK